MDKILMGSSYYAASLIPSGSYDHDIHSMTQFSVKLKEEIEPERLQCAVDKAISICPYVTYDVVIKDELPGVFYYCNNDKFSICQFSELEKKNKNPESRRFCYVAWQENGIYVFISHLITDCTGLFEFCKALLTFYVSLDSTYSSKIDPASSDYSLDLMETELPVSGAGAALAAAIPKGDDIFRLPFVHKFTHEEDSRGRIVANLKDFEELKSRLKLSNQGTLMLLLARAIQRVHPNNDRDIVIRGPVDTRRILGAEHTYQNASVPHIFATFTPGEFSAKKTGQTMKEQLTYDYLAHVTNSYGNSVRMTADGKQNFWGEIFNEPSIFASWMGHIFPEELENTAIDADVFTCSQAVFPFMMYAFSFGASLIIVLLQRIRDNKYMDALLQEFRFENVEIKEIDEMRPFL